MPNNSIYTIKDYFNRHKGLQRINRFDVSFENLPFSLPNYEDSQKFYPVQEATIGKRAINFIDDGLYGYKYGRLQPRLQLIPEEVMLIFSITNDNHILELFNNWFNILYSGSRATAYDESTTNRFIIPFYDDAVKDVQMKVRLLDPNGNVNSVFTFFEVMPAEAQPIQMQMKEHNFLTYQVQMAFREFTVTKS